MPAIVVSTVRTNSTDVLSYAHASNPEGSPMNDQGPLSPTDQLLIAALAAGATQRQVARTAGVSERTVRRRLNEPEFRRHLNLASSAAAARLSESVVEAESLVPHALRNLSMLLDDPNAGVRLRASKASRCSSRRRFPCRDRDAPGADRRRRRRVLHAWSRRGRDRPRACRDPGLRRTLPPVDRTAPARRASVP